MSKATPISAATHKTDMPQLAADVVERALRAGATDAEVVIREGDEFSTLVRLGQVETLKESGARGIGSARLSGLQRIPSHRQHLHQRLLRSRPGPSGLGRCRSGPGHLRRSLRRLA